MKSKIITLQNSSVNQPESFKVIYPRVEAYCDDMLIPTYNGWKDKRPRRIVRTQEKPFCINVLPPDLVKEPPN